MNIVFNIKKIPSLIESNNSILSGTSKDITDGLKIYHDNLWYVCGNLALNEGKLPHKLINSSPSDVDYQILLKASLLLMQDSIEQPLTITTGFPYSTYHLHREDAINCIKKTHHIEYDASTFFLNGGKKTALLDVHQVDVMPEVVGCAVALRKGEAQENGNFFVLSCGFGTFESILSTDSGIVEQSMTSTIGMSYAVNLMMKGLVNNHYLEFRNTHLMDEAFQRGSIILNKKLIDLKELRRNALRAYYQEVISPNLRNVITDANLMKTNRIFLCGGAMYYEDLVNCFKAEFGEIAHLTVVSDPAHLASKGYALNSLRISGGQKQSSIGIDIGNATTVVSQPI